jgi:hypothetical protein
METEKRSARDVRVGLKQEQLRAILPRGITSAHCELEPHSATARHDSMRQGGESEGGARARILLARAQVRSEEFTGRRVERMSRVEVQ